MHGALTRFTGLPSTLESGETVNGGPSMREPSELSNAFALGASLLLVALSMPIWLLVSARASAMQDGGGSCEAP
jgi:hypothetical protein